MPAAQEQLVGEDGPTAPRLDEIQDIVAPIETPIREMSGFVSWHSVLAFGQILP